MTDKEKKVREVLSALLGRGEAEFEPDASLKDDFDVDSTEMVEVVCKMEKAFSTSLGDGAEKKIRTVRDIYTLVGAEAG
ncbi:acyl carrier protein [Pyxidicoccus trucidator]|uniref:acyl carrier protein n=1 Tax=Pyxidicoccus trucidator TaxID=2709662 RepID=UPI0013D9F8CA|nr:phosphopantetheine-binding protein [Pyxidicoccus trucidator]